MEAKLNIKSPRAAKARYSQKLGNKLLQSSLVLFGVVFFIAGLGLVLTSSSAGYLLLSITIICFMLRSWYQGELKYLAPSGQSVDGLLAQDTLARLKSSSPSAEEVWQATGKSEASFFFQNRFMVHSSIFGYLSKEPGSGQVVWQKAEELRAKHGKPSFDNGLLVVALLKSIPNIEQMLRQIQLEFKDIEDGIEWLAHIEAKRRLAAQKRHFGGWARDFTFGYTPLLRYLGHYISQEIQTYGFFTDTSRHQNVVEQMVQGMSTGNSTVTLVGDIGVGKTTCVYAFADRLIEDKALSKKIKYNQVVSLDAPSILAQTKNPGELEGIILRLLKEAGKAKNIILFFDDAHVFFGGGEASSVDLSNILQPVLESGSVRLIFAMTSRDWQTLSTKNPSIASQLQSIRMQPANEPETIEVLRDQVMFLEYERKVLFSYQALREAFKLGSRYVDSQAMPGAALSVLKGATPLARDGYVTDDVVKQSIESSTGVKLQHVGGDETKTLLNLEDELHKFVINQKRAVGVIANALRRSRSGVGNPERPVGTFLFLGPTGVGKTELSKALARVYFGSEQSLIRVDMNQYLQPSDAERLITPMLGGQLGFLGQVRKAPFSVILLDEIEKAHPNVVNLLLQMLDEGVMRDADNKNVSFKDSIIIATSNAGADEIRKIIDAGKDLAKEEKSFVEGLINRGSFAPEFLNRFDEVVLFRPLSPEELLQVIDLIIAGINKTLDAKKVKVTLSLEAKKWLVNKGYDSKLGARPMRRVVQRYVENILARKLLDQSTVSGGEVHLDTVDFEKLEVN